MDLVSATPKNVELHKVNINIYQLEKPLSIEIVAEPLLKMFKEES